MARGINKVILVGNLGADPEVRYMPQGGAVAGATLATSESWTDKASGEKKEQTEWHRIVFYNKLAEIVGEYARKGSKIYVEGKLKTRKWTDKEGIDRYTTEIIVSELQLLDSRQGDAAPAQQQYTDPNATAPQGRHFQQPTQQQRPAQQTQQRPAQQQQRPAQQPQQRPAQQQYNPPIDDSFLDDIPF